MRKLLVLTAAVLGLVVAGPATAATKAVQIKAAGFSPGSVTINTRDVVRWTNTDTVNHQVVSDRGHFASPILKPGQVYTRTFNEAGTFKYHDGLEPAEKGTVIVKGPPPSVTVGVSLPEVTFGTQIQVGGQVSSLKVGESVTILAQPFGQASFVEIATVQTTTNGLFGFVTTPELLTVYKAKWGNRESTTVMTQVRPKVTLGRRSGWFIAKVTAARQFSRKQVAIQRLSALGQWVVLKKVTLNSQSAQRFRVKLPRGTSRLRLAMSVNQAGVGYLGAYSNTLVFNLR